MLLLFLLSIADESDHDKIVFLVNHFHKDALAVAKKRLYKKSVKEYEAEAEDIVSDVYLKLVQNIKSIDFTKSEKEIKSYILISVVNRINLLFKEKEYIEVSIDDYDEKDLSEQDFVEYLVIKERYSEVVEAIRELDEKYRIPLTYKYYYEKSNREIADLMEISEETVRKRLQRGRQKLIKILESKEAGEVNK